MRYFTLITICLVFAGCSRDNVSAPIGTWNGDNDETFVLQQDGTFNLRDPSSNKMSGVLLFAEGSGRYEMVDSTHIRLEAATPLGTLSQTYNVSVSGGDLSLGLPGSSKINRYHHTTN